MTLNDCNHQMHKNALAHGGRERERDHAFVTTEDIQIPLAHSLRVNKSQTSDIL